MNHFEENKAETPDQTVSEDHIEAVREQGGMFVEAVRRTRMPMLVTDATLPGNPIVFANHSFVALSGYTMAELLGQAPHFMNGEATDPEAIRRYESAIMEGRDETQEIKQYRKDGTSFWAMLFASPIDDGQGTVTNHFLSYLDITVRHQVEEELQESKRQLATLIDNMPGVIFRCDADPPWPFTLMSEGAETLTGYRAADFVAGHLRWADIVYPEDLKRLENIVSKAKESRGPSSAEYRIITYSGDVRWVLHRMQLVSDASATPMFAEGIIIDITRQKEADERIRWTAQHDPLTGLPNRVLFSERLEEGVEQTSGTGCSLGLLYLDIDHLKQVNDTLGHSAGDALLVEVATRLRKSVRSWDTVSRIGGDEFAVVLRDIESAARLEGIITDIFNGLKAPFSYGEQPVECLVSIGASLWPNLAADAPDLQKQADLALQVAKSSGRGKGILFEPEMRAAAHRRASMLNHARRVVEKQQIEPFYQPKVILQTGELAGFEALLRWHNPHGMIELPGAIQAAFEDPRLAVAIGTQMQVQVLTDMRHWLDAGVEFGHVAINASAAEFRSGNYAEQLLERLHKNGITAQCLEVEVTETVFLGRGAEFVEQALRMLHAEGITIALDDFGTGYASLSHLKHFPVDVIKIDRTFVQDLESNPEDTAILKAILSLGQGLGLVTVAEGIETIAQATFFRTHGCDLGQGYLFAKPGPRSFVPALVSSLQKGRTTAGTYGDSEEKL
ncbi:putative bifunctional diguanylate cyclase/phosphodiesterase [Microvirga antarctica]|uniref:putative bifunctional diguanylate cyclase/phosphodiesterase n=1 Tax=Microvirga antarctica TaxID=2819233 RepID=UPI001B30F900|nr:EAL domain-containing protein [Microvirga antarctica]